MTVAALCLHRAGERTTPARQTGGRGGGSRPLQGTHGARHTASQAVGIRTAWWPPRTRGRRQSYSELQRTGSTAFRTLVNGLCDFRKRGKVHVLVPFFFMLNSEHLTFVHECLREHGQDTTRPLQYTAPRAWLQYSTTHGYSRPQQTRPWAPPTGPRPAPHNAGAHTATHTAYPPHAPPGRS